MPTKRMTYREKLLDPRWQRKRLEILERDGFRCFQCQNATEILHVHHGYYERGLDPWEYESDTLRTLCATCHEESGKIMAYIHHAVAIVMFYGDGWCDEYWKDRIDAALMVLLEEHRRQFNPAPAGVSP